MVPTKALVIAILVLLGTCALAYPHQPSPPAEVDASHKHIYELMRREFGENPPVSAQDYEVHDIPMRDGVTLRTRIWFPTGHQAGDKRAVVYDRTPYGPAYTAMSLIWTFDGYVIVMQDQRGTFGSGGNFEIWRKDGQDAYDTMEWISQQEWSNGKVFSFGVSADAVSIYPQILYDNPWLQAQFPIFGVDNGHKLCYPGGVYLKNLVERWLDGVCVECIQDVKDNEQDGEFWDPVNMTSHYGNIHFPSIHWAGWYDIFLQGQIQAFEGYKKKAPEAYRDDIYLFVEPHGHCYDNVYAKGISLLGLKLGRKIFQLSNTGVRDPLLDEVKALNLFVMGPIDRGLLQPGNYYTSLEDWPTPTLTPYYLTGSGKLETLVPSNDTTFSYKYDPADPAETYGGNNLFASCGPMDQASIEARSDVLTFTTEALTRDTAIVGTPQVVLFVSTTANDTDFLVKLTDVYPDGRSILVQEGSIRLKWKGDKRAPPVLVTPGEIYEVTIDIWPTALVFARGHSIRVSVTSSNDPRFDPNPNNGKLLVEGGDKVAAENSIHVGKSTPSRLILPLVSQDQIPEASYNKIL